MKTELIITLTDGKEFREAFEIIDDAPRHLINSLAFGEAYSKYNAKGVLLKSITASNDWFEKINFENSKPADELPLKDIRDDFNKWHTDAPAWSRFLFPVLVWIASRTWWKWKFNFEYYVSIPFWMYTYSVRKKYGVHHWSDDSNGDT